MGIGASVTLIASGNNGIATALRHALCLNGKMREVPEKHTTFLGVDRVRCPQVEREQPRQVRSAAISAMREARNLHKLARPCALVKRAVSPAMAAWEGACLAVPAVAAAGVVAAALDAPVSVVAARACENLS